MISTDPTRTLQITRAIAATPERVYDAWLDPAIARLWLFATPEGEMIRADVDARPGGRFTFVDLRDGEEIEHVGEYQTLERPRRLVFTFGVPRYSPVTTQVTVRIEATASGCEVTLRHEGVLPEWAERTQEGWGRLLAALAGTVETDVRDRTYGQQIAPDTLRLVRLLPGPVERVWSYLADSEKRGQWLAEGVLPGRVGAKVKLHFQNTRLSPEQAPAPAGYEHCAESARSEHTVTCFEPPHRLGLSWGGPETPSEVTFELVQVGAQTRLTVTHRRLDLETMIEVGAGWHTHLFILEERMLGQNPPAFWRLFGELGPIYRARLR